MVYVVTPVDFVPDVIPVLGVIDDLIFIPVALALAAPFIPAPVLADCRGRATEIAARSVSRRTWLALAGLWLALIAIGVLTALKQA